MRRNPAALIVAMTFMILAVDLAIPAHEDPLIEIPFLTDSREVLAHFVETRARSPAGRSCPRDSP